MNIRPFLPLLLLLLCGGMTALHGQVQEHISMIARSTTDSVQLRWAPASPLLWRAARNQGIRLTRQTMMRDGKLLPLAERQQQRVLADNLRPQPVEAFATAGAEDDFVAIGGQALYGESFLPQTDPEDEVSLGALFNASTEQDNRFSFGLYAADQSWQAATLLALGYLDTEVNANETYLYTLRGADGPIAGLDTLNSGFIAIEVSNNAPPPKISDVSGDFRDKVVMISWNLEVARNYYSSYAIDRSVDGLTWEQINDSPFIPVSKEDQAPRAYYQATFPENNRPYFFRVRGRTPFANYGQASNPVQGLGKDPLPATAPSISGVFPNQDGGFDLGWTFPDEANVNNFQVFRSSSVRGKYEPVSELLPPDARNFRDENPLRANYYKVVVFDKYNRELSSFSILAQLDDTTPPVTPLNLRGIIMDDGQVIINWDANTEEDLLGYRIWLANQPSDEFKLATGEPLANNYWIGKTTLNTLTPNLYAKITALDTRHNPSPFSDYIELLRPDTIPPAPPLLKSIEATDESLDLYFATSRTPDIERHELFRRPAGDTSWQLIATYPFPAEREASQHRDTKLEAGVAHEYRLDAVDYTGLRGQSKVMVGEILDNHIGETVRKVRAEANRREGSVALSWTYTPDRDELQYFEIYRAKAGETPDVVGRLQPETLPQKDKKWSHAYTDSGPLRMNTDYDYQVRAVYADGALSRLSPAVTVNY